MSTTTVAEKTKFCRDCHYARNKYSPSWSCTAPQNLTEHINIVTGDTIPLYSSAMESRYTTAACGIEAKWFKSAREFLAAHDATTRTLNSKFIGGRATRVSGASGGV